LNREELHNCALRHIRVIKGVKSRRFGRSELVARMGKVKNVFSISRGNLKKSLDGLDIDGRIILKYFFKTQDLRFWTGFKQLRKGSIIDMLLAW
jgi:hypothetical protein